jgi:hypothetical protein
MLFIKVVGVIETKVMAFHGQNITDVNWQQIVK